MNVPEFGFGAKPVKVSWGGKFLTFGYVSSSGVDGDPAPIVTIKNLREDGDKILITDVVQQGKGPKWAVYQNSLKKVLFSNHQPLSISNQIDVRTGQVKTLRGDKTTDPFEFTINIPHAEYPTHSYAFQITLFTFKSDVNTGTQNPITFLQHNFAGGGSVGYPGTQDLLIEARMDYKSGELTLGWVNPTWDVDFAP